MPLATLSIDIEAKLAKLESGMSQATRIAQKNAAQIERAFSGVRGALGGVGGALAVAIPATFLVSAIRNSLTAIDSFNDLRDATGASVESISALDDVARRSGTTFETAGDALIRFNKVLKDAKPNDDASRIFKALNLDIAELKRLDPAEALLRTAVAFKGFADDGNKARAFQELLGKSVKETAAFMKDLGEAGKLTATTTSAQAEEVERLNKELFKLQGNFTNAGRAVIVEVVPAINRLIESMRESVKEGTALKDTLAFFVRNSVAGVIVRGIADSIPESSEIERLQNLIVGLENIQNREPGNDRNNRQLGRLREQVRLLKEADQFRGLPDLGGVVAPAPPPLRSLGDLFGGKDTKDAAAIARALSAKKAYDELIRSVSERVTLAQAELDTGAKLTEAQRFALDVLGKLAAVDAKFTDGQKRLVAGELERLITIERTTAAQKDLLDTRLKTAEIERRSLDNLGNEAERRIESNAQLQRYIEQIGLTERQLQDLELARLRDAVATERQTIVQAKNIEGNEADVAARERNLRLLEQELQLRESGTFKERRIESDPGTGISRAIDQYLEKTGKLGTETERAFGSAIDAVEQGLSGLLKTGNSTVDALIAEFFRLNVVRPFLSSLFGLLGSGSGGGGSDALGAFIAGFGGFRARGGPLNADKWYVAGEQGPELIAGPGMVFPSAQTSALLAGGGAPTIVQYNTFNGGVSRNEVISGMVAAKNAALGEWADGARRGRWAGVRN